LHRVTSISKICVVFNLHFRQYHHASTPMFCIMSCPHLPMKRHSSPYAFKDPPPDICASHELTEQQRADLRNMFPCLFPATSSMQSVQDRVSTFFNWSFTRATPQMHAEAGFFSLGTSRDTPLTSNDF